MQMVEKSSGKTRRERELGGTTFAFLLACCRSLGLVVTSFFPFPRVLYADAWRPLGLCLGSPA